MSFLEFNLSFKKGFTLIELMVVISIIGILASLSMYSYNSTQGKARDARRKSDLRDLQKALQQYYQDNGSYPSTGGSGSWNSSEPGNTPGFPNGPGNNGQWIPGSPVPFVPNYIARLPRDPSGGAGINNAVCGNGSYTRQYLYTSNGNDYALLSWCSAEGALNASDPLTDPCRTTWAWKVASKGTYSQTIPGCAANTGW